MNRIKCFLTNIGIFTIKLCLIALLISPIIAIVSFLNDPVNFITLTVSIYLIVVMIVIPFSFCLLFLYLLVTLIFWAISGLFKRRY
jgi:hypothetical protein